MSLTIAILEDNRDRRIEMFRWLDDRLYMYPVVWFRSAGEMIEWLRKDSRDPLVMIALDHDLEPMAHGLDPGTGRDVVDFLVSTSLSFPKVPVVVHTTNALARIGMVEALREHGWPVREVFPYDDLSWVGESWYPEVKAAIREGAVIPVV
jgi:hypothetical protein